MNCITSHTGLLRYREVYAAKTQIMQSLRAASVLISQSVCQSNNLHHAQHKNTVAAKSLKNMVVI
jgi:hypothetical protein